MLVTCLRGRVETYGLNMGDKGMDKNANDAGLDGVAQPPGDGAERDRGAAFAAYCRGTPKREMPSAAPVSVKVDGVAIRGECVNVVRHAFGVLSVTADDGTSPRVVVDIGGVASRGTARPIPSVQLEMAGHYGSAMPVGIQTVAWLPDGVLSILLDGRGLNTSVAVAQPRDLLRLAFEGGVDVSALMDDSSTYEGFVESLERQLKYTR